MAITDPLGAGQELTGARCASSSTILIPRKGWHMLLNLCFHIAMTAAVFAGGITLTGYLIVCQAEVKHEKVRLPQKRYGKPAPVKVLETFPWASPLG
ncbi:hypothetical protein llap_21249 [Limosa lapponica baueri]|uniref:Uncharacterized protein n=1 Tax=Limosa lapponica baueri TaxID=1758121 RepID=A0A2I0T3T9_LIMLA|nr:hypothetical protein llap_21249 [Limosa lapponica baueri]